MSACLSPLCVQSATRAEKVHVIRGWALSSCLSAEASRPASPTLSMSLHAFHVAPRRVSLLPHLGSAASAKRSAHVRIGRLCLMFHPGSVSYGDGRPSTLMRILL